MQEDFTTVVYHKDEGKFSKWVFIFFCFCIKWRRWWQKHAFVDTGCVVREITDEEQS